MRTKRKAAKGAKKRTIQRSAASGKFGADEKALDKLTESIYERVMSATFVHETLKDEIKAELRAATTVTERVEEAIGEGWVEVDDGGRVVVDRRSEICEHVAVYARRFPRFAEQYVRLVPADPPAPSRARRKKA